MDTLYRTKIYDNETVVANIRMRKTRLVFVIILNTLCMLICPIYISTLDKEETTMEFYLFLIIGIVVFCICMFFIIHTLLRTLKTIYTLTNQRIIVKEFIMFKYYGNSFKYDLVEDISIKKNELLGTYNIDVTLNTETTVQLYGAPTADSHPQLVGLSKHDADLFVEMLNKYNQKKNNKKVS